MRVRTRKVIALDISSEALLFAGFVAGHPSRSQSSRS
jgi:hypothetical protein